MSDLCLNNRGRVTGGEPNPVDKYIGEQIRRRRLMLNISQEKLAAMIGLTFQQIQKYEKGMNRISGSRVWDICQALEIEPNVLFMGMDDQTANQSPRMMKYNPEEMKQAEIIPTDPLYMPETMELLTVYYRLNPKLRKLFYETMLQATHAAPAEG